MKTSSQSTPPDLPIIDPVGVGFRSPHYQEIMDNPPNLGWFEVHPENYFGGGINRHQLTKIRQNFPISMHSVGLSLGSDQAVDTNHLRQIKDLIDIYEPFIISDHVSWSASGNAHLNDLLPLPYNSETLQRLCNNIDQCQEYFGRKMLVENPSTYLAFNDNEMKEYELLNELVARTGCGILLDINNIYVQSHNHGIDALEYIDNVKHEHIGEIHLAGHIERKITQDDGEHIILVDTHNQLVKAEVWDLYDYAVKKMGSIPTLIEWDQDFPPLKTLVSEAALARNIIEGKRDAA